MSEKLYADFWLHDGEEGDASSSYPHVVQGLTVYRRIKDNYQKETGPACVKKEEHNDKRLEESFNSDMNNEIKNSHSKSRFWCII